MSKEARDNNGLLPFNPKLVAVKNSRCPDHQSDQKYYQPLFGHLWFRVKSFIEFHVQFRGKKDQNYRQN